ncbi:MAG: low molecular weight protein-tyrosine-phosphatase [Clostridia bacterium]|nr:low molecular weight protein-tyrosine-phosphatase [Clostridia bacterium]
MVQKRGLEKAFYAESAATSTEEIWNGIGNPVYPPARDELRRHGIRCEGKRARQVTAADYEDFDLLLCAESWNIRNLRRIIPSDPEGKIHRMLDFSDRPRDIADPWYSGDFSACWDDITEACESLLAHLTRG